MIPQRGRCDIAIVGGGMFASLITLALLAHRPELRLSLFTHTNQMPVAKPELLIVDSVSAAGLALLQGAIVRNWDRHYLAGDSYVEAVVGDVALIDPGQLHLDLIELSRRSLTIVPEALSTVTGSSLIVGAKRYDADFVIDAREAVTAGLISRSAEKGHRDLQRLHRLDAPILADFSFVSPTCDYLELTPLDGTSVMAHQIKLLTAPSPKREKCTFGISLYQEAKAASVDLHHAPLQRTIPLRAHWAEALAIALAELPTID